jgi:epoxyqueuosine reductase
MTTSSEPFYEYKVMSVRHLPELRHFYDGLEDGGRISDNKTLHRYIDSMEFEVPEELLNAKSIVIIAVASKLGSVNIHHKNMVKQAYVPQNYYDMGPSPDDLIDLIRKDIIKKQGYHFSRTKLHLKLLAVRSGLAKYGRNNITYVDGMGSFFNLFAFFTDYEFDQDDWCKMEMLSFCQSCTLCLNNCPTGAIRENDMVINAGKCLSIYNEIPGEIPTWIPSEAHNSLMGCMRCQIHCPGNKMAIQDIREFAPISETSVHQIIHEDDRDEFHAVFGPIFEIEDEQSINYFFPVFKRNLEVLLQ